MAYDEGPRTTSGPRRAADATRRAAGASARGARRVGHATGRAAGAFRQTRRATHAEGAGESGCPG